MKPKSILIVVLLAVALSSSCAPIFAQIPELPPEKRLEANFVQYIANLEALREKEIARHDAESAPMARVIFTSQRKVQLDAKIAATKYCLSNLRREFPNLTTPKK